MRGYTPFAHSAPTPPSANNVGVRAENNVICSTKTSGSSTIDAPTLAFISMRAGGCPASALGLRPRQPNPWYRDADTS